MSVYVVTGAASGIGLASTLRLLAGGHEVWCLDQDQSRLAAAYAALEFAGRAHVVPTDVSDPNEVEAAFDHMREQRVFSVDGLVNSAGIVAINRFDELSVDDWERTYRVNVIGTYLLIKSAIPLLRAAGTASVVNVASMAGKLPGPFTAPYNASKAAVISLTRTASFALAPQIRVNAICPGVVHTPMYELIDTRLTELGAPDILQSERRAATSPLGRRATADEIARVVQFLLSDDSSYMTGEDVNVSGGFVMH